MDIIMDLIEGFFTWQTPLSFMAGVGAHHLYAKYIRDREGPHMLTKKTDGTYRYSTRFWVICAVSAMMFGFIGWRTQDTADRVEDQVNFTTAYGFQTNDCLNQLISVLTTRVGYNEEIAKLDARRQQIWEQLVTDLADSEGNTSLNRGALDRFFEANEGIKSDQAKIAQQREKNQYPDCSQDLP
jgi:hypothetical protein